MAPRLALLSLGLLATLPLALAQVSACKDQGCQDCPLFAAYDAGFPDCLVYETAGQFSEYAAEGGNGYRVWWNSDQVTESCRIIVRTPASQDINQCGYYLTGWSQAGCYYTLLQQSFMLQFCCGTGDCNDASPAATRQVGTVDEARSFALMGGTASTSLVFTNLTQLAEEGKRSFGDMGLEVHVEDVKRTPLHMSGLANQRRSDNPNEIVTRQGRDCRYTETGQFTRAGRQQRVSTTNNCNVDGGCSITIESSVSSGRTISVNAGFNLFSIISLGTDISFTEEESRSLSATFSQEAGTRGYVSFIPTDICTVGQVENCDGISNGQIEACTPRLIGDFNDGVYSFVFE